VTSNLRLFLRDKSRVLDFSLESPGQDFERFFNAFSAAGNLQGALAEWDAVHAAHGQRKLPIKLARIARRWRNRLT
jgi:hypothetical protein